MKLIHTASEMRAWSLARKAAGQTVGFVPTMGALHEGHASLMRAARARDDAAVLSVFVNPTQFGPEEDYDRYPRTWEADQAMAVDIGMDAIYVPDAREMYPEGYATYVMVEGVSSGLCSRTRPHFFRGVATVVTKLLNAVLPDRAYFGQKDGQQCAVIRRMARDLDMGVEIVEMPTVREPDGLAMSSRNKYLSAEERKRALCLSRSLFAARARLDAGERDGAALLDLVREGMAGVTIDYVELVDADSMCPVDRVRGRVMLAVAALVGNARLIDNIMFTPPECAG
ncbi:MAG TPA: pantoate--beta-alanine ligase [Candidatus Hydrogenedentes bacterium]|nr:pantoate--beta-alanine ligase [Candidatus Hydrogenedentota bacterium]HNT89875.1 pantoate--beta-alanine ligase [Candidatus Hydrogenedentota bacterium]